MPDSSRSSRPARSRSVYAGVIGFYILLFLAVMWPVYPRFATIEPRILGMPFSLAYVVVALLLSFVVLLGFFRWEDARGANDEPIGADSPPGDDEVSARPSGAHGKAD